MFWNLISLMSKLMINAMKESYNSTPPKAFPSREFWICFQVHIEYKSKIQYPTTSAISINNNLWSKLLNLLFVELKIN
jgi:hypothetical protein